MSSRILAGLALIGVTCLVACYRPQGALLAYSGEAHTYYSTETAPKSVRLLDTRSGEVLFSIDIPVGRQLTLDFVEGDGDDPVYTPDLMRYELFKIGTTLGRLRSSLSVPPANARRLDVQMRQGPEFQTADGGRALRTDELIDRPDWWTPEGGELPEDPQGRKQYHD